MRLQYDLSLTGGDEGQSSVKEVRPKEVAWTGSKSVTHTHTHTVLQPQPKVKLLISCSLSGDLQGEEELVQ